MTTKDREAILKRFREKYQDLKYMELPIHTSIIESLEAHLLDEIERAEEYDNVGEIELVELGDVEVFKLEE
jgi:hypothetical protein